MSICPVIGHCVMPKEIFNATMWKKDTEFLDDAVYEICVSPFARKNNALQIHLAVLSDDKIVRFADLNAQLKKPRVEAYLGELQKRLTEVLEAHFQWEDDGDHDVVISYGGMESWNAEAELNTTNLRVVLMLKDTLPLDHGEDAIVRKKLKGELLNWMEEVRHDVQVNRTEMYEKDYHAILAAELLPHDKENTDILNTMTIIAAAVLVVSFFLLDWFFFQVIALVIAGYTGFRAVQKQKYICAGICLVIVIVAIVLCVISYRDLQESMKGIELTIPQKK